MTNAKFTTQSGWRMLGTGTLVLPGDKFPFTRLIHGIGREAWHMGNRPPMLPPGVTMTNIDKEAMARMIGAWITGCVVYLDGFGKAHATLFHRIYRSPSGIDMRGGVFPVFDLSPDLNGNDAY